MPKRKLRHTTYLFKYSIKNNLDYKNIITHHITDWLSSVYDMMSDIIKRINIHVLSRENNIYIHLEHYGKIPKIDIVNIYDFNKKTSEFNINEDFKKYNNTPYRKLL